MKHNSVIEPQMDADGRRYETQAAGAWNLFRCRLKSAFLLICGHLRPSAVNGISLFPFLLFASACLLRAEPTNSTASASDSEAALITSKSVDFDLKTRRAVYRGNVHVVVPPMELNCELLTAKVMTNSTRVESIIASSNVVALMREPGGAIYTNWCEKAVYTFKVDGSLTNETLVLTGSPVVIKWETKSSTADSITWDIGHDAIHADNLRGVFPDVKSLRNPVKREPTEVAPVNPATEPKPSSP